MNPDYEQQLAAKIDATLKALPELQAPDNLMRRVMASVVQRQALPWYRQSWQMWPATLRYVSLAVMIGSFGALCFFSWQLTQAAGTTAALQEVGRLFSGVTVLWNALVTVLNGLVLALKHLHPAILFGCLAGLALAWALCVGLGTACVRLAWAKR